MCPQPGQSYHPALGPLIAHHDSGARLAAGSLDGRPGAAYLGVHPAPSPWFSPGQHYPAVAAEARFEDWAAREAAGAQQRAAAVAAVAQRRVDDLLAAQGRAAREEAEAEQRAANLVEARERAAQQALAAQQQAAKEAVVAQQRAAKLMADQERAAREEMEAQQRATHLMEAQDDAAHEAAEAQEWAAHEARVAKERAAQMVAEAQRAAAEVQAAQQRAAQRAAIQKAIALQQHAAQEAIAAQQVAARLIAEHERSTLHHREHLLPLGPQLGPPNPAIDAPRIIDNLVDDELELQRQAEFNSWKEALRKKKMAKMQTAPTRATYLLPNPDGTLPASPYSAAVHPTLSEYQQLMDAARATAVSLPKDTPHGQVRKRETAAPATAPVPTAPGASPPAQTAPTRLPTPLPTDPTPESSAGTQLLPDGDVSPLVTSPAAAGSVLEQLEQLESTTPTSTEPARRWVPTPLWPRDPYLPATTRTRTTPAPSPPSPQGMFAPGHSHNPYWPPKGKTPKKYKPPVTGAPRQGEVTSAWPFQNATNEDDDLDLPPGLGPVLDSGEEQALTASGSQGGPPPPPPPPPQPGRDSALQQGPRPPLLARLLAPYPGPVDGEVQQLMDNESLLRRTRHCEWEQRGCGGLDQTWTRLQALVTPRAALSRSKRASGAGSGLLDSSMLASRGMAATAASAARQLEAQCALFGG